MGGHGDLFPDFVEQLLLLARSLGQTYQLAGELLGLALEGVGGAAPNLAQLIYLLEEGGQLGCCRSGAKASVEPLPWPFWPLHVAG